MLSTPNSLFLTFSLPISTYAGTTEREHNLVYLRELNKMVKLNCLENGKYRGLFEMCENSVPSSRLGLQGPLLCAHPLPTFSMGSAQLCPRDC